MSKMNKIGFTILTLFAFLTISCSCQNFFWSHNGSTETFTTIKYGYLYNWYATQGTGTTSITSTDDWALMTSTQRNALTAYLGGNSVAGGKLKDTISTYWAVPNTGATNETGFNARGGGVRTAAGVFQSITTSADHWCSNQLDASNGQGFRLASGTASLTNYSAAKNTGNTVRLIYVGAGTPTSYTGNDGKVYRVTEINSIFYLADNLSETKLRDGTWIPGYDGGVYTPIANATWAGLSTGALCVYNDDENNK